MEFEGSGREHHFILISRISKISFSLQESPFKNANNSEPGHNQPTLTLSVNVSAEISRNKLEGRCPVADGEG